jgi:hypothetical protein
MSTPEKLAEEAAAGVPYENPNEPAIKPPVYSQLDTVISLTIDHKQAWILSVLLQPYKNAEEGDWEMVRAAEDVRRRIASAMGYEGG